MIKNKFIISIITLLCLICICVGGYHLLIQDPMHTYIADLPLSVVGVFYTFKVAKNDNLKSVIKMRFSLFFFLYGLFFLVRDIFIIFNAGSIHEIDTFYLLSDCLIIILSLLLCDKDICVIIQRFFK